MTISATKIFLTGIRKRAQYHFIRKEYFSYFQTNKRALAISQKTAMPQRLNEPLLPHISERSYMAPDHL